MLSYKLTDQAHKDARVIVYTSKTQKLPYVQDTKALHAALVKVHEKIEKRDSYNAQVMNDLGIEFQYKYLGFVDGAEKSGWSGDQWEVTGQEGRFNMCLFYGVGHRVCFWDAPSANNVTALIVPPSAMDTLYHIKMDDPHYMPFEEWCATFGYDEDSRKAEKTYNACVKQIAMFKYAYPSINLDCYAPLENF